MTAIPFLYLAIFLLLLTFWVVGEVQDKPVLRRVCGPLSALLLATAVGGFAVLHVAFDDSIRYSGAMKRFVSALIDAIDRGESERAHDELRRFDKISIETYEGGALLEWLTDPVERLDVDHASGDSSSPNTEDDAVQ
ncbi:hypothetical protein [Aporhodopirellula aestuarii]|uniref:Uncharacterized protein n=1 Tax=Aporhodopirellula aestuarii TaxID=2950107 RepID=A0ABT0U136_9BACT|nr:hypothetical protein [Aporhodopirellula aestuarii]MCM2370609.1 hypothetical protein [Aporhodopirellula aestuarii]